MLQGVEQANHHEPCYWQASGGITNRKSVRCYSDGSLSFTGICESGEFTHCAEGQKSGATSRQFTGKSGKTKGDFCRPGRLVDHYSEKVKVTPAACDDRGRTQEASAPMPANHTPHSDTQFEQRIIIHQLLRDDHTERWTPKQLQRALSDIEPETIDEAVAELEEAGVAWRLDDYVGASHCTRYLFSLDLITI